MLTRGFIFDYAKCVGCHACVVACYNENKTEPPIAWRQVNSLNQKKIPLAGFLNLSTACNHCIDAPCIKACPANAYKRDDRTGAVIHQYEKCIGCKYCTWACPYDAPKYNQSKGIVEKCHFCNHLIEKGLIPACANQCPTGALSFGSIDTADRAESIGIPETAYQPKLKTLRSIVVKDIPMMDCSVFGFNQDRDDLLLDKPNDKISAFEEWPLALFTLTFAFLTGWIFSFKSDEPSIRKIIFCILGLIGVALSTFHLGKPFRALRSVLNLKTSWLSREILFCALFILSSTLYQLFFHSIIFLIISSFFGVLLLISFEMVYSISKKKYCKTPLHSSNTVLTALLFGFYYGGMLKPLVAVIVLKALLYLVRKGETINFLQPMEALISSMRVVGGIVFPLGAIFFSNPINSMIILICLLIGEVIDRFEFYNDIYVDSPSRALYQTSRELLEK